MSASTAPGVKAALITLWQAQPLLAGVQVSWGAPVSDGDVTEEMIFFVDTSLAEDWIHLGNLRREENYKLGFQIRVRQAGDDEQNSEERLWVLYDAMLAAMRADPSLGHKIIQFRGVDAVQRNTPLPGQWDAVLVGEIAIQARK